MSPAAGHALGRAGEAAAADELVRQGYAVLARNWRAGRLELDLVCEKDGVLVFVEVKARGSGSLGTPADGLTARKRGALLRAAELYLTRNGQWSRPCRFDVAEVWPGSADAPLRVRLLQDAFGFDTSAGWQPW